MSIVFAAVINRETARHLEKYAIQKVAESPVICRKNKSQTKVRCVEANTIFNSMTEAADLTGIHISNISRACNKQCKKAGGYTWEYVEKCKRQGAKQQKKAVRCIDTGYASHLRPDKITEEVNNIFENLPVFQMA